MGKRTFAHTVGKVHVAEVRLPRAMRGIDPEWDVATFTEGPIRRLLNRRRG
jgi:hypothetical protein